MSIEQVAAQLVIARRYGRALATFPGDIPETLEDAYAIQRRAIELSQGEIAGWKVGRITGAWQARLCFDRFVGPVFASKVAQVRDGYDAKFPLFVGGSAAFEAEYAYVLGGDVDDPSGAHAAVAAVRIAVEVAGSPVTDLPRLGPLASIADLGNNNGQLLGACVPSAMWWQPGALPCQVEINGQVVASADATALPGGPAAALTFAAEQTARLGFPLRAGQFVSTGAVTGMHPVVPDQQLSAAFGPWGRINCTTPR